jgi:hypothetical protein
MVGLLALTLLAAGCGSQSSESSTSGASSGPCSWLTDSEVAGILGHPIKGPGAVLNLGGVCEWDTNGPTAQIRGDHLVLQGDDISGFANPFNPLHNKRVPTTGIGDQAYFLIASIVGLDINPSNELHVLSGQHVLIVTVWRDAYQDDAHGLDHQKQDEIAAARLALPRLG